MRAARKVDEPNEESREAGDGRSGKQIKIRIRSKRRETGEVGLEAPTYVRGRQGVSPFRSTPSSAARPAGVRV
jgi:hypothetical protein